MKKRLTWYQTDESSLEVTWEQRRTSIVLEKNCHGGQCPWEVIVISLTIVTIGCRKYYRNYTQLTEQRQAI